jgi:hypothetical protein
MGSPGCTYFFLKILSLLLFLAKESRHFSIDLIVALFPGHSSETMLSELRRALMNVIFHMKTDQFVQIFYDWVR